MLNSHGRTLVHVSREGPSGRPMLESDYSRTSSGLQVPKSKRTRPPFGYYGAKQRVASQIIRSLPPHNAWVEAFCGSAAVTVAKPPAPIEVINDIDDQIINVFEQIRNNLEHLSRVIALTPYARSEFLRCREPQKDLGPLEKARRFLVATMMVVNGTSDGTRSGFSYSQSYARNGREARVNRWCNLPSRLSAVAERLKNVRVEKPRCARIATNVQGPPRYIGVLGPSLLY